MMAAHCSFSGPLSPLQASSHLSRLDMAQNQFTGSCCLHVWPQVQCRPAARWCLQESAFAEQNWCCMSFGQAAGRACSSDQHQLASYQHIQGLFGPCPSCCAFALPSCRNLRRACQLQVGGYEARRVPTTILLLLAYALSSCGCICAQSSFKVLAALCKQHEQFPLLLQVLCPRTGISLQTSCSS